MHVKYILKKPIMLNKFTPISLIKPVHKSIMFRSIYAITKGKISFFFFLNFFTAKQYKNK